MNNELFIFFIINIMYVKELTLKNFRNYKNLQIEFSPAMNFIIGENGTGKTNILEAVSIISNIKSFRNIHDSEIIKWGDKSYYCSSIVNNSEYKKFEVGCAYVADKLKKRIKIDGKDIKAISEYYGKLLTVIFSPIDINIINGTPDLRRKFFDSVISKIDTHYFQALNKLKKILISRNKVLKQIKEKKNKDFSQLDVWDHMFSETASIIIKKRINFIEKFITIFKLSFLTIGKEDAPEIDYYTTTESPDFESILQLLNKTRSKDINIGFTGIGPQRDDYIFRNLNKNSFINYASQGQKRTAAIALKITENEMIEHEVGVKSIILVDDIFSELDEKRRHNMIDILKRGNQVIFTMVNSNIIKMNDFTDFRCFEIESPGNVKLL